MRLRQSLLALLVGSALGLVAPAVAPPPASAAARTCDGRKATIIGTQGRDVLVGTPRADVIVGLGGSDRISGLGGDDWLCGGGEDDRIDGGDGDDRVFGQGDRCFRFEGDCILDGNVLSGGRGNDLIVGSDPRVPDDLRFPGATRGVVVDLAAGTSTGQGKDVLVGVGSSVTTEFGDTVRGLRPGDSVFTLAGGDVVTGRGADGVDTGAGDDTVDVGSGPGDVYLGSGDDTVTGSGDIWVNGQAGDDTVTVSGDGEPTVNLGAGDDVVESAAGDDLIRAGAGSDEVDAGGGDDVLIDGGGDDTVDAGAGDDVTVAGTGDDTYDGGLGVDRIDFGQTDADADGAGVRIDLAAGTSSGPAGDDVVAGTEDVEGSRYADVIFGDDGPNELDGGSGSVDEVHGRGGADSLAVRFGTAELYGDAGRDTLFLVFAYDGIDGMAFDGGADQDRLVALGDIGDGDPVTVDLAAGTITGIGTAPITGVEDVTDDEGDNTLIGDAGPNVLRGGEGDDDLRGNGGDDQLFGEAGADSADGGEGTDTCEAETVTACEG